MNNFIHQTAIIGQNVQITGTNNYIGPYCVLQGNTTIGSNNRFEAFCSIGAPAEHRDYFNSNEGHTVIGDNNIFREYITVNAGTTNDTILHNNIVMLRNSHVGHDCTIESNVNLSCNVLIGGHSYIMQGANFGLGSICHQFSKIGAYSMIGMGCIITKTRKVLPGHVVVGNPASFVKMNETGLQRNNITDEQLKNYERLYEEL